MEIDDEGQSLNFYDDFATEVYKIFPEVKTYERHFSINDDAFFATQKYEYKVASDPLSVSERLIESFTEPPLEYEVKDGVVLESEIKKNDLLQLRLGKIEDLKKIVKWQKLENNALLYYILSLHPEVLTKNEYRRFLREAQEKLKSGLSLVEAKVKQDDTGLEVLEDEHGRQIWYKDYKPASDAEFKKNIEYVEKNYYKPLFEEKSKEYSGISKDEFRASTRMLDVLAQFLERDSPHKKAGKITGQESSKNGFPKWVFIISLLVIAYYWGIWTAVGILVLGTALYLLFKS